MQVLWDLTEECFWEILRISGVHTEKTKILSGASGHAVIQVDKKRAEQYHDLRGSK